MGKTKYLYKEKSPKGSKVKVADRAYLEEFLPGPGSRCCQMRPVCCNRTTSSRACRLRLISANNVTGCRMLATAVVFPILSRTKVPGDRNKQKLELDSGFDHFTTSGIGTRGVTTI